MKTTVTVTELDVLAARRLLAANELGKRSQCCPIALAAYRAFSAFHVSVSQLTIRVWLTRGETPAFARTEGNLPPAARDFVRRFDEDDPLPPLPFSFELETEGVQTTPSQPE